MKLFKRIVCLFILAGIIGAGYGIYSYQNNLKPVSNQEELVEFTVENGATVSGVITQLKQKGLIKDEFWAKVFTKLNSVNSLQANEYILNKNLGLKDIFTILQNGSFEYLKQSSMTIVDGTSIQEIAEVLSEHLEMSTDEILAVFKDVEFAKELINEYPMLTEEILQPGIIYPLEGYLYPETYNLTNIEADLKVYIRLMLDATQQVIDEHADAIKARDMSVHEFLSFVSVVESESLYDQDKNKIAGVFYNRLAIDMPLGSDVTVLYALNKSTVNVTYDDLKVDSPYNTYIHTGLPIGPICNASLSTIEACLNPEESSYYYFFACQDGTVLYSTTYEEHLQKANENKWY